LGAVPAAAASTSGALVIGMADEPDRQRQRPLVLNDGEPGLVVLGAAGSGRSAALRALAAQAADLVAVPSTPEEGWDAVGDAERAPRGATIVIDDLDLLLARLPHDHATALRERIERLAREARARGVRLIVSAQRPSGAVARVVDAIPSRLLLAHASRADYVAAGGAAADFLPLPPGRGHLGGVLVQTPWTVEPDPAVIPSSPPVRWHPSRQAVAYVAPAGRATRAVLAAWADRGADVVSVDEPGAQLRRGGVVWGSPESWLGQWRLLSVARTDARLVVDAACGPQYRAVTGSSELPPYALPGAGRAWLCVPGGTVSRILLPPPPGGSQARASASGAAVRP
jgi:S-DNA-T family DNA segregation ATPase FtsK/SpoIIIE